MSKRAPRAEAQRDNENEGKPLADVVAFVDVRTEGSAVNDSVSQQIENLGGKVAKTFTNAVTHVVFKNGAKTTVAKAQQRQLPVVSVLWVESCKTKRIKARESDYPADIQSPAPVRVNAHARLLTTQRMSMVPEKISGDDKKAKDSKGRVLCEETQAPDEDVDDEAVEATPPRMANQRGTPNSTPSLLAVRPAKSSPANLEELVFGDAAPRSPGKQYGKKARSFSPVVVPSTMPASGPSSPVHPAACAPAVPAFPESPQLVKPARRRQLVRSPNLDSDDDEGQERDSNNSTPPPVLSSVLYSGGKHPAETAREIDSPGIPSSRTPAKVAEPAAARPKQVEKKRGSDDVDHSGEESDDFAEKGASGKTKTPPKAQEKSKDKDAGSKKGKESGEAEISKATSRSAKEQVAKEDVHSSDVKSAGGKTGGAPKDGGKGLTTPAKEKAQPATKQPAKKGKPSKEEEDEEEDDKVHSKETKEQEKKAEEKSKTGKGSTPAKSKKAAAVDEDDEEKADAKSSDKKSKSSQAEKSKDGSKQPEKVASSKDKPAKPAKPAKRSAEEEEERPAKKSAAAKTSKSDEAGEAPPVKAKMAPSKEKESAGKGKKRPHHESDEEEEEGDDAKAQAPAPKGKGKTNSKIPKGWRLEDVRLKTHTPPTLSMALSGLDDDTSELVHAAVHHLGKFKICEDFSIAQPPITHVVVAGGRTLKVLGAIATGCWLLSPEWVTASITAQRWLPEDPYELSSKFPAAQVARLERTAKQSCKQIFNKDVLYIDEDIPKRPFVTWLVRACGAKLADKPATATVIVQDHPAVRDVGSTPRVTMRWVAESIASRKLQPFEGYSP